MSGNYFKIYYIMPLLIIALIPISANCWADERDAWKACNDSFWGGNVQAIVVDPDDTSKIYIGTLGGGFYYSKNEGKSWTQHNKNLKSWDILTLMIKEVNNEKRIYAGTSQGIYWIKSNDISNGVWSYFSDSNVYKIYKLRNCQDKQHQNAFYAIASHVGDSKSQKILLVLEENRKDSRPIESFDFNGKVLNVYDTAPFVAFEKQGEEYKAIEKIENVIVGTDSGIFGFKDRRGLDDKKLSYRKVLTLAERFFYYNDGTPGFIFYAGTDDTGRYARNFQDWHPFLSDSSIVHLEPWYTGTFDFQKIYAITSNYRIMFSENGTENESWHEVSRNGLFDQSINILGVNEKTIEHPYLGTTRGIYFKINADFWESKNCSGFYANRIHDIIYDSSSTSDQLWAATDGSMYHCSLANSRWQIDDRFYSHVTSLARGIDYLIAGTKGNYIYKKSPIFAGNWEKKKNGLSDSNITIIHLDKKNRLWAGTEEGIIYQSNDSGENWSDMGVSGLKNTYITDIIVNDSMNYCVSALNYGVAKISDSQIEKRWTDQPNIYSMAQTTQTYSIFAGTDDGIFICSNFNGFNWNQYILQNKKISKIKIIPTISCFDGILYAMIIDSLGELNKSTKIYRNIIGFPDLIDCTNELKFPDYQIGESFCVNQENPNIVYLGTNGSGVYKYEFPIKELEGLPIEVQFSDVPQGSPYKMSYSIRNPNSFMPLQVAWDLEGPDRDNFIAEINKLMFYPNDPAYLVVVFDPKPPYGSKNATLKITCNDIFERKGFESAFSIPLSGIGRYGEFDIDSTDSRVDTIFVDFDSVHVDSEKIIKIKWQNFGNVELIKESISYSSSIEFSEWGFPDSCAKESSDYINLSFNPNSMGKKQDNVKINYYYMVGQEKISCRTKVIILEGVGVQSIFFSEPSKVLDFGKVPVWSSKPKKVTIKNNGNLPLIIDTAYIASACSTFIIQKKPSDTIFFGTPDSSCLIDYSPEDTITYNDTLIIIHKDKLLKSPESDSIVLTGVGIDTVLQPTPPFIVEFGQIHLNDLKEPFPQKYLKIENLSPQISLIEVYDLKNETGDYIIDKSKLPILLDNSKPSDNVSIIFKPNIPELREFPDWLSIYYKFRSEPFYTKIKLHAEVVSGKPEVIPPCLRFDKNVHVHSSGEDFIALKNSGNIPIYFDFLPPNAPFELVNITDLKGEIEKFSEDTIEFRFSPIDINPISSIISIKFCDSLNQKRYLDTTLPETLWGQGADAIACFPDSFRCLDTQVGNSDTFRVEFSNVGNIDMQNIEAWCNSANFQVVSRSINKVEPNKYNFLEIRFSPDEFREYASICSVRYTDSFNFVDTVIFLVNGRGWGFYSMGHSPDPIVLKQPVSIWAKVRDDISAFETSMTRLWIRRGGEITFDSLSYSDFVQIDCETTKFNWELPADWISSRGIEFYFEAFKNKDQKPAHYPFDRKFNYFSPSIRIPNTWNQAENYNGELVPFHAGNEQNDYRLISIPANIDSNRNSVAEILQHIFGFQNYDEYYWRCADYHYFAEADTSYYIYLNDKRFSEFEPGKSFFLIMHKGFKNRYFLYPPGYTNSSDNIYAIPLHKNWNLIANPFNFPIPLKNLARSKSGKIDSILTYAGGWISEKVQLNPWTGYAICCIEEPESLLINPDLRQSFLNEIANEKDDTPEYLWNISIEASCQNVSDNNNLVGASPNASVGYDKYDQLEPPVIGEYVMLTFPHPEWKKSYYYFTIDVQQPNPKGNFWDFDVYTNIKNSGVKLQFKNLESVPKNFQVMLICEHLNHIQDLRKGSQFIYNSTTANESYPFRVIVGEPDFVRENKLNVDFMPKDFKLIGNFPNPFNGSTTIRYELPDEDAITIYIYNVLGELIKTLEKDNKHAAGKYFIVWDGTNESGTPASSGVYFCKFVSSYQSRMFKMVLIR